MKKEYLLRGGSWLPYPRYCRSAFRDLSYRRDEINYNVGFRIVRKKEYGTTLRENGTAFGGEIK